jgi:hypothetical protein
MAFFALEPGVRGLDTHQYRDAACIDTKVQLSFICFVLFLVSIGFVFRTAMDVVVYENRSLANPDCVNRE